MNKKQLILSLIMTLLIAIFMVFSPRYIISSRTPLTMQRNAEKEEIYQGIITVWHIVGFKPYQGSLGAWVSDVAAQLEKKHSGVYFEVDSITLEEYEARIARGEQPDVFSYPLGSVYAEQLMELSIDLPTFRGNLGNVGCYDSRLYSVPYTASGYLTVHNQRLMQEMGMDADNILDVLKSGNISAAGNTVQACIYGITGELMNEEDFLNEKAVSAFVDARAVGDLGRKVQNGKGFPFEISSCCNYTDLVQLIGANTNTSAEKMPYIYELMELCLNEEHQKKLMNIGLMPAILDIEIKKAETEAVEQLFKELENIAAPNNFLYKTYEDQLELSAVEAMRGSASAKKDLELRLTELVRGATIK